MKPEDLALARRSLLQASKLDPAARNGLDSTRLRRATASATSAGVRMLTEGSPFGTCPVAAASATNCTAIKDLATLRDDVRRLPALAWSKGQA